MADLIPCFSASCPKWRASVTSSATVFRIRDGYFLLALGRKKNGDNPMMVGIEPVTSCRIGKGPGRKHGSIHFEALAPRAAVPAGARSISCEIVVAETVESIRAQSKGFESCASAFGGFRNLRTALGLRAAGKNGDDQNESKDHPRLIVGVENVHGVAPG